MGRSSRLEPSVLSPAYRRFLAFAFAVTLLIRNSSVISHVSVQLRHLNLVPYKLQSFQLRNLDLQRRVNMSIHFRTVGIVTLQFNCSYWRIDVSNAQWSLPFLRGYELSWALSFFDVFFDVFVFEKNLSSVVRARWWSLDLIIFYEFIIMCSQRTSIADLHDVALHWQYTRCTCMHWECHEGTLDIRVL